MRRVIALAACLAAGILSALVLTRPARAGLDCTTDTAAAVVGATVTDRGLGWSTAANPYPLWTVDITSLNASYDLQAPDDAGARAAAKVILDKQLAAMGCGVTTTTASTTTQQTTTTAPVTPTAPPAPVTTTVVSTQTQTITQPVSSPGVVVFVPQAPPPAQTVTNVATVTVTTPAPAPKVVTVKAKPALCKPATKKKPAKKRRR